MGTHKVPITCREMTRDDIEAVIPLLEQLGYSVAGEALVHRFVSIQASDEHALFVAENSGHVTGVVHIYARPALEKPSEAIVQSMVVEEAARGTGVGRALMTAAEAWARDRGFSSVALHSQIERDDAHAFYQRLGYERVATANLLRKAL